MARWLMLSPSLVMLTSSMPGTKVCRAHEPATGKGRPSPFTLRKRIRPVVLYGFVALACLLTVTTWVVDECAALRRRYYEKLVDTMLIEPPPRPPLELERFLVFNVEEGLTNQRIGIVSGLLIASLMGRTAVFPNLKTSYLPEATHEVPFDAMYDRAATTAGLRGMVNVASQDELKDWVVRKGNPSTRSVSVYNKHHPARWYAELGAQTKADIVVLDNAFAALSLLNRPLLIRRWWAIDQALVHARKLRIPAEDLQAQLAAMSPTGRYSALHLRVEGDWVEHCQSWEGGDHCMTNTEVIHNVLEIERVPREEPLFLASGLTWSRLKELPYIQALSKRYRIVTKEALLPALYSQYDALADREVLAEIDFIICSKAHTFIGNSVSTFSALLMLRREHELGYDPEQRTIAYNGRPIPLAEYVPNLPHPELSQRPLKWVFALTGNSESGNSHYDRMAKVAVLSALNHTSLHPVCLYWGKESPMTTWLRGQGVTVILHEPAWIDKLKLADDLMRRNQQASHLFGKHSAMVGTFLRIDVPVVGFADQHVLYTDVDVYFRADVKVEDFANKKALKRSFFVAGPEFNGWGVKLRDGRFVGNAGVMLLNVPALRRTYDAFLSFTFSKENLRQGFMFHELGPGDQGAYNTYYQGKFEVTAWPVFNWKPYWQFDEAAKIIHFHGPKPHEYHDFQAGKPGPAIFAPILQLCNFKSASNGCRRWLDEYDMFVASTPLSQ